MADINQVITLGIGTPAGIPEFLTFGLQIGEEADIWTIQPDASTTWTIQTDDTTTWTIQA